MILEKTTLLATFCKRTDLDTTLQKIKEQFLISNSKIFLLKNKDDEDKIIFTYNIALTENKVQFDQKIPGTVSLHRKKETNTLYTINSLNKIVLNETQSSVINKNHVINWSEYQNCILIIKNKELIKINTELESIINV